MQTGCDMASSVLERRMVMTTIPPPGVRVRVRGAQPVPVARRHGHRWCGATLRWAHIPAARRSRQGSRQGQTSPGVRRHQCGAAGLYVPHLRGDPPPAPARRAGHEGSRDWVGRCVAMPGCRCAYGRRDAHRHWSLIGPRDVRGGRWPLSLGPGGGPANLVVHGSGRRREPGKKHGPAVSPIAGRKRRYRDDAGTGWG